MSIVTDNQSGRRFEAHDGDELAGFADYIRTDELVAFTHTEVAAAHEGRGVGSLLARAGVEVAQSNWLKVLAICPLIAGWLERHPDYIHLEYRSTSNVIDRSHWLSTSTALNPRRP